MKPARLNFVVANPDHNARMISQTLDVIDGFLSHVVEKRLVARIQAAAKHKILPDENSHFVATVVEIVTLVNAATPNPHHVHVGVAH